MSVTLMTETNLYKDDAIADGLEDASKVATNYLSYNAQDGLTVGRTGQSERAVITSDGMEIYDGQNTNIAEFKAVTRLGEEDSGNLKLDYHSFQLQNVDGDVYVHLSDLRNQQGYTVITQTFRYVQYYDPTYYLRFQLMTDGLISVTLNGNPFTRYTSGTNSDGESYVHFNNAMIYNDDEVVITYKTISPVIAFTFGKVKTDAEIGAYSFISGYDLSASGNYSSAEGYGCTAINDYSHVEGYKCVAGREDMPWVTHYDDDKQKTVSIMKFPSHAEGRKCVANGVASHAEGWECVAGVNSYYSSADVGQHAEGYKCTSSGSAGAHAEGWGSVANGRSSHAEGKDTTASANYSHTGGNHTTANCLCQTAIGQYNTGNNSVQYLFTVGGGNDSATKDVLNLDISGNLTITGTLTQSSDKRLKLHHAYLSDQEQDVTSFIESLKPAYFEKDQAKHLGFYAQDVQLSDKWDTMVSEDTNGYLALGYTEIIAPLVAYVQNQQKKIDSLEERIARLEQLINQQ